MKKMTYVQAMRDFFGAKPNQSPLDFMKELKALSDADKAWFTENLATVGYEIIAAA